MWKDRFGDLLERHTYMREQNSMTISDLETKLDITKRDRKKKTKMLMKKIAAMRQRSLIEQCFEYLLICFLSQTYYISSKMLESYNYLYKFVCSVHGQSMEKF